MGAPGIDIGTRFCQPVRMHAPLSYATLAVSALCFLTPCAAVEPERPADVVDAGSARGQLLFLGEGADRRDVEGGHGVVGRLHADR